MSAAVEIKPGMHVKIRQIIHRREGDWVREVQGEVVEIRSEPNHSWYAHAKDNQYWIRRIVLKKPDGELSTLTLDSHSDIQPL